MNVLEPLPRFSPKFLKSKNHKYEPYPKTSPKHEFKYKHNKKQQNHTKSELQTIKSNFKIQTNKSHTTTINKG